MNRVLKNIFLLSLLYGALNAAQQSQQTQDFENEPGAPSQVIDNDEKKKNEKVVDEYFALDFSQMPDQVLQNGLYFRPHSESFKMLGKHKRYIDKFAQRIEEEDKKLMLFPVSLCSNFTISTQEAGILIVPLVSGSVGVELADDHIHGDFRFGVKKGMKYTFYEERPERALNNVLCCLETELTKEDFPKL